MNKSLVPEGGLGFTFLQLSSGFLPKNLIIYELPTFG